MSHLLYWVRLFFRDGKGWATYKPHNVDVRLTIPPAIAGVEPYEEIEYAPEVQVAIIRPRFMGIRDMRREEVEACIAYLVDL